MDTTLINKNFSTPGLTGALKADNLSTVKGEDKTDKELKEACQGFEAIFIQTMMKSMRSTLPGDDLFGGGQGKDIYISMHDQYLAEKISQGENTTGIGGYLYNELKRL